MSYFVRKHIQTLLYTTHGECHNIGGGQTAILMSG